jgi:hypothetical protein
MSMSIRTAKLAVLSLAAVSALAFVGNRTLIGADHLDPPTRTDAARDSTPDVPADIADVYAFHTPTDVVLALTFAGPQPANRAPIYDRDVLYKINVSNDGDPRTTEFPIEIRFGFDGQAVGVQVKNLPGGRTITGPVETTLEQNGILVRAGIYDDPFYFDLQGFRETVATGTLAFRTNRDFFAGQNDTGIVIQIPRSQIQSGQRQLDVWSSSARFGGQL